MSLVSGQTASTAQAVAPPPAPVILIDPAHGGADPGAILSAAFPEKDVTLVLARRLRQELVARGVRAQLVRDGDDTISTDQRAAVVNAAHPALYLVIHASSQGSGIHLFSAVLPAADENRGPFVSWNSAQALPIARSRVLVMQIAAGMSKSALPVRSLSAPLRPLNSVTVPAFAMEVAPGGGDVSQLASSVFQQKLCGSLAQAIASTMPVLKAQMQQAAP